jgi:hypothetical protein
MPYIRRIRAMGIRDHPVAARSPHLHRILKTYAVYYNRVRTHLSLDKDAPSSRCSHNVGRIVAMPILGGLHHQYVRV